MEDNMKRISLLLLVILLLPIGLFAQNKNINFTYDILSIPKSIIFIDSVIDSRNDTNRIGSAEFENMKKVINFKTGAKDAFFKYLSFNIPKQYYYTPIIVEIKELNVIKEKTSDYDSIKTSLILGFSTKQLDSTIQLYQAKATNQINAKDGFKDVELTIKSCLEQCFTEFINNKKQEIEYYKLEIIYPKETVTKTDTISIKEEISESSTAIVVGYDHGVAARGATFTYYYFDNNSSEWLRPVLLGFEIQYLNPDYFSRTGLRSAKLSYTKPGVNFMRRLAPYTYLSYRFQVPIGLEVLNEEKNNMFIGLYLSQGIYFVQNKGLLLGASVFEYISSSKAYDFDIGFKFEIGMKF